VPLFGLFGPPDIDKLEEKGNVKGLAKALCNENPEIRQGAAKALLRIGRPEAQRALADYLDKVKADSAVWNADQEVEPKAPMPRPEELSGTAREVALALKAWYREQAKLWWQTRELDIAVCCDRSEILVRDAGYLCLPGYFLCCERCTDSSLAQSTNWDEALADMKRYFGPAVPPDIIALAAAAAPGAGAIPQAKEEADDVVASSCPRCGGTLVQALSGRIAAFLGLPSWPCIKCDIGAATVVVSERGIIAERHPAIVITRRSADGRLECLYGLGSIASPGENTAGGVIRDANAALTLMKTLFEQAVQDPVALEARLRAQGAR
jgi:hypothetical protein